MKPSDKKGTDENECEFLEERLNAATKDRDVWKIFDENRGQMKDDDPNFGPSFSCKLVRDPTLRKGYTRCRNKKYDECAFHHCRCRDRKSYQDWLKHHKKDHPKDKLLVVHNDCQECKRLRDEEVVFMDGAILKVNNKIKSMGSLADIVREMIPPERTWEPPVDGNRFKADDKTFSERK
jgi:hypothetical protein